MWNVSLISNHYWNNRNYKKDMKDKFKTNAFAKKYKRELEEIDIFPDIEDSVKQIKRWNNYGVGMQVSFLWSITLAFIIGAVVCAGFIH